ncbi:MAG TPA: hypothetical protein PKA55_07540 [Rhodoblastus sp.]|nr:hypothetical protein [Rhodoblastus sp.]
MRRSSTLAALLGMAACTAQAADLPQPVPPPAPPEAGSARPDWALQVTPYLWASGLNGRVSPFRLAPTVHVEKSFGDVMKNFNIGGFLHVWARKGSFVANADIMYVSTTDSHSVDPLPFVGSVRARLTTGLFYATLVGGYRVLDVGPVTFDALAGGRLWNVSNRASIDFAFVSLGFAKSLTWVDPVVGGRAFWRLTDAFSIQAQGDIGGFGAGSKLTWQALGTLNYAFAEHFSASLGYKVLRTNYARGGYVFDVTMSGPVLGVTYRF